MNDKYFELLTVRNDKHEYPTEDKKGIKVCFNTKCNDLDDAWFCKVETRELA